VIRALLYIRMPEGVADERGFNLLRRMREETGRGLTLSAFKKLLREQFFMLLLDERRAVEAIPAMLAKDSRLASALIEKTAGLIAVVGVRSETAKKRLAEIKAMIADIFGPRALAKGDSEDESLSGSLRPVGAAKRTG
jgi:hypothetical protein